MLYSLTRQLDYKIVSFLVLFLGIGSSIKATALKKIVSIFFKAALRTNKPWMQDVFMNFALSPKRKHYKLTRSCEFVIV